MACCVGAEVEVAHGGGMGGSVGFSGGSTVGARG
jgi:hypothetical protein